MNSERISFQTEGVCADEISFELKDGLVHNVCFNGGCGGNTTGLSMLLEGMPIEEAKKRLRGIDCGGKGTSCPDQFVKALDSVSGIK